MTLIDDDSAIEKKGAREENVRKKRTMEDPKKMKSRKKGTKKIKRKKREKKGMLRSRPLKKKAKMKDRHSTPKMGELSLLTFSFKIT